MYAAIGPAYMRGTYYLSQRFLGSTGKAGSPTYMIFQLLLFYISPNALLVQPFFSILFDSGFSFISNVPIHAIPN